MAGWRATKGYVGEVGAAIARAAVSEQAAGKHVTTSANRTAPTELEWSRAIARTMRWNGEFVVLPDDRLPAHRRAPGNTAQHWVTDTSKFRRELGVGEAIAREEAIRRTVEWERANPPGGFTPHQFDYGAEDAV